MPACRLHPAMTRLTERPAMTENRTDPIRPTDDEARTLARGLLVDARFAALAYTDPETGTPGISRIAFGLAPDGCPTTLISRLAAHHPALSAHPDAAVMVGEAGEKGDPLVHPRLMVRVRAEPVAANDPCRAALREKWLAEHPKSVVYIDFPDFGFVRLVPHSALLNGGFGRAYRLTADELT